MKRLWQWVYLRSVDKLAWEFLGVRGEFISFAYPSAWNWVLLTSQNSVTPTLMAETPTNGQAGQGG